MELPEHDERMADYLGDEMDPAERARFEAELASDERRAAEVAALRRAVETMRGLESVEQWSSAPPTAVTGGGDRRATWRAVLRYAAVIALAFLVGWVVRGASVGTPSPQRPQLVPPQPIVMTPVEQRFAESYQGNAARSGLGRLLIAIAQTSGE